jgi:hypothetical protein
MSTLKTNNVQVGQSVTATNNFTLYQPSSPDGTVRLGVGNSGATSSDVAVVSNAGNLMLGTATWGYAGNRGIQNRTSGSDNSSIFLETASATIKGFMASDPTASRVGLGSLSAHPLVFIVNDAERARIDTSGNWYMNSGFGSSAIAYGCRAWVNFNGSGTVAIRASGNVSSITDNGTGDFTVNFATAMSDANFSGVVSNSGVVNVAHTVCFLGSPGSNDTSSHPNSSSFRFSFYSTTNSGARGDPVMANVSVFR